MVSFAAEELFSLLGFLFFFCSHYHLHYWGPALEVFLCLKVELIPYVLLCRIWGFGSYAEVLISAGAEFCVGEPWGSGFMLLHVAIQFGQHHLLEILFAPIMFSSLWKHQVAIGAHCISNPNMRMSGFSIPFHWWMCLLCADTMLASLLTRDQQIILLLFIIILPNLYLSHFPSKFKVFFSTSVKNCVRIFRGLHWI